MLEYTAIPEWYPENTDNPEGQSIPVPDIMEQALIDYLKARVAEDAKDIQLTEYYMQRFKSKVAEASNARVGGLRKISNGSWGIR